MSIGNCVPERVLLVIDVLYPFWYMVVVVSLRIESICCVIEVLLFSTLPVISIPFIVVFIYIGVRYTWAMFSADGLLSVIISSDDMDLPCKASSISLEVATDRIEKSSLVVTSTVWLVSITTAKSIFLSIIFVESVSCKFE